MLGPQWAENEGDMMKSPACIVSLMRYLHGCVASEARAQTNTLFTPYVKHEKRLRAAGWGSMKAGFTLARTTAILLLLVGAPAVAQTVTIPDEYGKLIQSRAEIAGLGSALFGDQVNLYTGALEFVQVDLSIPGNNGLPVSVGRRFTHNQTTVAGGHFGDWDLEIPHLQGVFSTARGWVSTESSTPYQRCSQFGRPPAQTV